MARGLASAPVIIPKEKYRVVCPVDPLASGTWIAASDYGDVVCLLNGAFKKHKHRPPYRLSRGIVVLNYFESGNPEQFSADYNLGNIEPFTMVIVHRGKKPELYELRWDGKEKFFTPLNEKEFHLWSSATLYDEESAARKLSSFQKILSEERARIENRGEISPEKLISIHRQFLYEEWVKPPQRVTEVSTLSVTAVESGFESLTMHYRDLVNKEKQLTSIELMLSGTNKF